MSFCLLNKRNNRKLIEPGVGTWITADLVKARYFLGNVLLYLKLFDLESLAPNYAIVDAETGEEVEFLIGDNITVR